MKQSKELKRKEIQELKALVREKGGYVFKSNALLIQAFTRSSYSSQNNEILELIGDRILDYYVAMTIAERFGSVNLSG